MADEGILDDPNYIETDNGILDDPNYVDDDGILDDPDYVASTSLDDAGIIDDPEYNQFTEIDKEELGIIDDDGILDDPNYDQDVNSDYNTALNSNCNDYKTEESENSTIKTISAASGNAIVIEDADKNENINVDIDNDSQFSDCNLNEDEVADTLNLSCNDNDNLCNLNQSKNLAELGIIDDDYEITIERDNTNADEKSSLSKSDNIQHPTAAQDFQDANINDSDIANAKNEISTLPIRIRNNSSSKGKVTDKEASNSNNSKNIDQASFRPKIITGRKIKEDKPNVEFSKKSSSNNIKKRNDEKNIPNVSLTVTEAGVDKSINRLRSETVVIDRRKDDNKNNNESGERIFLKNSRSSSSKSKRQRSHSDVGENVVNDEKVDKEITEESNRERRNTLSRSSNISPPRSLKLQKRPLLPSKLPAMKSPSATSPPFSNNKPSIKKSSSATTLYTDKISQPKQSSTTSSLSPSSPSPRSRLKHTTSASQLPSRVSKARTDTNEKKATSSNDHNRDATTVSNESKNTKMKSLSTRHSIHGLSTDSKSSPRISNSNKSVSNPSLLGEKSKRPASASSLSLGRFSRSTTNLSIKGNLSKDKEMEDLEKELKKTKAQMTEAKLEASQTIEEAHFLAAKAVEEMKLETSNQIKQAKQQAEQDLLQLKFDTDKEIFQLTHLYKHQKQNSQTWRKIAQKSDTAKEAMAIVIQVLQNKVTPV